MSEKLLGYLSWAGMWNGEFLFGSGGKLATLWFDELVLQVPHDRFISWVLHEVPGEPAAPEVIRELENVWVPVHKYKRDYIPLLEAWRSSHAGLPEIVTEVTTKEIFRESPELSKDDFAFRYDHAMEGAGLLEAVELWLFINSREPCCFIPRWREPLVVKELFGSAASGTPFELFSEIIEERMPDLEAEPWERIVELRHHPFMQAFRSKLWELHSRIGASPDKGRRDLINEIALSDMKELLHLLRPSRREYIFKAIASNLPMPIPVNPASVIFSALDVKRQLDIERKYGWLYFLLDVEPGGAEWQHMLPACRRCGELTCGARDW